MARIALSANTAWNLANFRRPIVEALLECGDQVIVLAGHHASINLSTGADNDG